MHLSKTLRVETTFADFKATEFENFRDAILEALEVALKHRTLVRVYLDFKDDEGELVSTKVVASIRGHKFMPDGKPLEIDERK